MTLPFFSCICLTYGRPDHLAESVACFQSQRYDGQSELIVFNTCPQQQIEISECPTNIKVFNCAERPSSVGDARNRAIAMASGTHLVTWDDDDLYLSHHLRNFGDHFGEKDWAWQTAQFYAINWKIQKLTSGTQNVVAFTKKAWEGAGRYANLNCGEDRDFVGRLTSMFEGVKIPLSPAEASFIYCWGNNAYHISGLGDDSRGRVNGWKRAERNFLNQVRLRRAKLGRIVVTPKLRFDYENLARDFLSRGSIESRPNSDAKAVVLLGRFGDIVNILPVLKKMSDSGQKPALVVAKAFAPVLSGVSYVEPVPIDIDFSEVDRAVRIARQKFKSVQIAQVWGKNYQVERRYPSFNQESWGLMGEADAFHDFSIKPVFDLRNRSREAMLVSKFRYSGKPLILVGLTGCKSSPFALGRTLLEHIVKRWRDTHTVIDLCSLYLENIYDLLGLFDAAELLITADTVYLHLAPASEVPVIAFVNPEPWLGTYPRLSCLAKIPYPKKLDLEGFDTIVQSALGSKLDETNVRISGTKSLIVHAAEFHAQRLDARILRVRKSWERLYKSENVVQRHLKHYDRTAVDIGDRRGLPYLKDVLAHAMAGHDDPKTIIMFTNDDNWLHSDLPDYLRYHLGDLGPCCCSQRSEFWGGNHPSDLMTPEQVKAAGSLHPGRDLFAFTVGWLQENWEKIPDYILGASDWDWGMCAMIRLHYSIVTTRKNVDDIFLPAEMPVGYVAHEHHTPAWIHPRNESTAPSQRHNRNLFRNWAASALPSMEFDTQGRLLK